MAITSHTESASDFTTPWAENTSLSIFGPVIPHRGQLVYPSTDYLRGGEFLVSAVIDGVDESQIVNSDNIGALNRWHPSDVSLTNWSTATTKNNDLTAWSFRIHEFSNMTAWSFRIHEFSNMIESRIRYIDTLRELGDGWTDDDNSRAPSLDVISKAKSVLKSLLKLLENDSKLPIPTLIMSPMPIGGFGLQCKLNKQKSLFLSIDNDKSAVVSRKINGAFSEKNLDYTTLEKCFAEEYVWLHSAK